MIRAHGLGGRSDLPIPLEWAVLAGAAVVLASFLSLLLLWRRPRLAADRGLAIPMLHHAVDAPLLRGGLRALALLALCAFLVVAWVGSDDASRNPAPTWFYVWFWVGLLPTSLVLGEVWRLVNPLRSVAGMVRSVLNLRPRPIPPRLADWPAEAGLLAFLWVELVSDTAASPRTVAIFVTCYAVLHIVAGTLCGPEWFERNDGFEVFATLIARAAPLGRRADGRVVLRSPLDGLAGTPGGPDPTALLVVVLGGAAFDGMSRTSAWAALVGGSGHTAYLVWGTVGLLGTVAAVAISYGAAIALTTRHVSAGRDLFGELAPALVPLVIGYSVAHYFSFTVFQGWQGVLLAVDPLGRGWDPLALASAPRNGVTLSADLILGVQLAAIVTGHVVAAVCAHDRAIGILAPARVLAGQLPVLFVMVGYTAVGIALLAGA